MRNLFVRLAKRDTARPSLRERAALLKASASRVIRRKPVNAAPADAPVAELAKTVSHELAAMVTEWAKLEELQDSGILSDEEADGLCPEWASLHARICHFPARSLADLCAKKPIYQYELDDERSSTKDGPSMPIRAWESVVGDIEALSAASASGADPILPMIEEARRLMRVSDAAFAASTDAADDDPRFAARNLLMDELWAHIDGTILKTVPRTATGCRELARFSIEFADSQGVPISSDEEAISGLIAKSPLVTERPTAKATAQEVDLSVLGANELCAFYEKLGAARAIWGGAMCEPLAEVDSSAQYYVVRTHFGKRVDFEDSRAGFLMDRIADEVSRRGATTDDDRNSLLGLRIQHEIACEGRILSPALLADIARMWG